MLPVEKSENDLGFSKKEEEYILKRLEFVGGEYPKAKNSKITRNYLPGSEIVVVFDSNYLNMVDFNEFACILEEMNTKVRESPHEISL